MPRYPLLGDVLEARDRLRGVALHTPLEPSRELADATGAAEVRLKLESAQPVGSFKVRGATNMVTMIAAEQPQARLLTASSGNHGRAVSAAAERHGMEVLILVGASVSPAKLAALRSLESERCTVQIAGRDTDDAEREARRREGLGEGRYVPPYNHALIVAGQATVAVEILEDWPACDTMVVPIGGGGLISGIGLWAKAMRPGMRLIGVQPAASPPMYAHLTTGATAAMPIGPTLADGVAGNIERNSITWKMCRQLVDEVVLVEEDEIAAAMRWAIEVPHVLLEGSGAMAIAALGAGKLGEVGGRRLALVITGRNVDAAVVRQVLAD